MTADGCRRFASLLAALVLCACASSPPVEFYALEPVKVRPLEAAPAPPLQIARVHLPPSLDRRQIVRQAGQYGLEISDRHRWSAPLDLMIRRTLSEDLLQILPRGRVVLPQEPAPARTRKVVIDIVRFMPDPAGRVELQASWSEMSDDGVSVPSSSIVNVRAAMASPSYSDQVAAMSEALARLAAMIAAKSG
ncbi:MAG TPA: PqiC family protein [Steroidobacteraceae bacterium]|nr:PqiC family protein [Steroidobacteraceae bacterium]